MLEDLVRDTIHRYDMIRPGDTVLVGVSGGPDSVALLTILHELRDEWALSLRAAHLNHGLRGAEAAADATFVEELCARMGVPCTMGEVDGHELMRRWGMSAEMAARRARHQFLTRVAEEVGAQRVALGHTADDQAETVLLRLLRGASLQGLAGIPPKTRGVIIRPLIEVRRHQVIQYLRERGVGWRVDETNWDTGIPRNWVRHRLIPLLEQEFQPGISTVLARLASVLRPDAEFLDAMARSRLQGLVRAQGESLYADLAQLKALPTALRRRVLLAACRRAGCPADALSYRHVAAMEALLETERGERYVDLPGGIRLGVGHGVMVWQPHGRTSPPRVEPKRLSVPGVTLVEELGVEFRADILSADHRVHLTQDAWTEYFDYEKLVLPLRCRTRRPGDRFHPLGMQASKKLQDFLVDLKVPRRLRDRVPLVESADGQIVWVVGYRMDDRYKINHSTRRVLRLSARSLEDLDCEAGCL